MAEIGSRNMFDKSNFKKRSVRGIIGLGTIIFVSFVLNISLLIGKAHEFKWKKKDSITVFGERFMGIKDLLPKFGVVGYISDVPENQIDTFVNFPALEKYLLTQYELTPLIVTKSPDRPLVVGNFSSSSSASPVEDHLLLVKNLGNGVKLFKRLTP